MFAYRVVEKMGLLHMTRNEIVNYGLTTVITIVRAIAISLCWNILLRKMQNKWGKENE